MDNLNRIEISLLKKGLVKKVPVVQGDTARYLEISLTDYTIPSGASARINAVKPDKTKIYNDCTIAENTVQIKLTGQMVALPGEVKCQVEIVKGVERITSFLFYLVVDDCLKDDSAIASRDEFTVLEQTMQDAKEVIDQWKDVGLGGTQILRGTNTNTAFVTSNSSWVNGSWRVYNTAVASVVKLSITGVPNPDIQYGVRITKTETTTDSGYRQDGVQQVIGEQYIVSCYARGATGGEYFKFQVGTSSDGWKTKEYILTTEWKRYSFEYVAGSALATIAFGMMSTRTGVVQICGEKLEVGNKATDWGQSSWDIANNMLKPVQLWTGSVLSGSLILSDSLNNYKAIIIQYGTPATGNSQLGYGSVVVRRWLESSWQETVAGQIAFATPLGYVQLANLTDTEMVVLHADNYVRGIYGLRI